MDNVTSPNHYRKHSLVIEPIELTGSMNAALGQALNYVLRHKDKGTPKEDLLKAIFYLNWFRHRYFEDMGLDQACILSEAEPLDFAIFEVFRTLYCTVSFEGEFLCTMLGNNESAMIDEERINKLVDMVESKLDELELLGHEQD